MKKRLRYFSCLRAVCVSTLMVLAAARTLYRSPENKRKATCVPQIQTTRDRLQSRQNRGMDTLTDFQKSDFYHTTIDNNLFRPLSWTPPRPCEAYRLKQILLEKDGKPRTLALNTTPLIK